MYKKINTKYRRNVPNNARYYPTEKNMRASVIKSELCCSMNLFIFVVNSYSAELSGNKYSFQEEIAYAKNPIIPSCW